MLFSFMSTGNHFSRNNVKQGWFLEYFNLEYFVAAEVAAFGKGM